MSGADAPRRRRRWPWFAAGAGVLVAVILAVGLANRDTPAEPVALVPAGERAAAPDIRLPVLQAADGVGPAGAEVALSSLRGRVLVVNVWAWWCKECRDEVPVLQDVSEEYDAAAVTVLGINSEDRLADARRFLVDYPTTYPSLRDPGPDSAKAFGMWAYPGTFIIDAEGRVAATHVGAVAEPGQITATVDRLLDAG